MYRTLIRIEKILDPYIFVVVSGWDPFKQIVISFDLAPEFLKKVECPYRCHAKVSLSAEQPMDLNFCEWENE
jgi:hypothetical protein